MSWADDFIRMLKNGDSVQFRPKGNSMTGKIESGQLVTMKPVRGPGDIGPNNIVLVKVNGTVWLHLVTAVGSDGRYQISNNKGHVNGWASLDNVYGVVTRVDP